MALKKPAVDGATIKILDVSITATKTILTTPSTTEKIDDKGVYIGTMNVQVSGATDTICNQTAPVPIPINPTSINKMSNQQIIRDDDQSASVPIAGTDGGGNPCTLNVQLEIDNPGQDNVLSD